MKISRSTAGISLPACDVKVGDKIKVNDTCSDYKRRGREGTVIFISPTSIYPVRVEFVSATHPGLTTEDVFSFSEVDRIWFLSAPKTTWDDTVKPSPIESDIFSYDCPRPKDDKKETEGDALMRFFSAKSGEWKGYRDE